jgi:hypothetical protein
VRPADTEVGTAPPSRTAAKLRVSRLGRPVAPPTGPDWQPRRALSLMVGPPRQRRGRRPLKESPVRSARPCQNRRRAASGVGLGRASQRPRPPPPCRLQRPVNVQSDPASLWARPAHGPHHRDHPRRPATSPRRRPPVSGGDSIRLADALIRQQSDAPRMTSPRREPRGRRPSRAGPTRGRLPQNA